MLVSCQVGVELVVLIRCSPSRTRCAPPAWPPDPGLSPHRAMKTIFLFSPESLTLSRFGVRFRRRNPSSCLSIRSLFIHRDPSLTAHRAETSLKTEQKASGPIRSCCAVAWNFHPELLRSMPGNATISSDVAGSGLVPGTGRGRIWLLPGPDPAYVSSSSRFGGDVVLLVYWLDRIPGASCGFFATCSTHAAVACRRGAHSGGG